MGTRAQQVPGTTAEAAVLAGKSTRTIRRWVAAGLVDGIKLGDRLMIDLASVVDKNGDTDGD